MTSFSILSAAELDAISNADRQLIETTKRFTASSTNNHTAENVFDKALHIKQTLDVFEEKAVVDPSKTVLAVLLNGEYQLIQLYKDTPLRHNPFLSHWVEAIQRMDALGLERVALPINHQGISKETIIVARTLWIKTLLSSNGAGSHMDGTPMSIATTLISDGLQSHFSLQLYIRMLEEEGIYEPQHLVHDSPPNTRRSDGKDNVQYSIQKWKDNLPRKLQDEPEQATFELTRLPIELSYLDYFTTILNDHALEKHSIDPAPVVTQYIQHSLRTIERMEKPPMNAQDAVENDFPDFPVEFRKDLEYGKEAQSRAVRLLLLFIKSLVRKGLVGADVLYFEIQEICVRYVWIKEVREFRTWIEEGVGEDGTG